MEAALKQLYKTLKNNLGRVGLEESWYVIWAFTRHFLFPNGTLKDFPNDIETPPEIMDHKNWQEKGLYPWDLAFIARDLVIHGQRDQRLARKSLKKWDYLAGTINKAKDFSNGLAKLFIHGSNINVELRRIAHQQFPWQMPLGYPTFIRYYKIFNSPRIADLIKTKIGISVQDFFAIGLLFLGGFIKHSKVKYDDEIIFGKIGKKELDIFTGLVSTDLQKLQEIIEKDIQLNENYVYAFNPLIFYPLIKIDIYYYCPLITFFIWRVTSGLYFDLIKKKDGGTDGDFANKFGFAFQDYVEEISNKILIQPKTKIYPEMDYGKGKKTIDLILEQDDAILFIDAKVKRLLARSKTELSDQAAINSDLDKITDEIAEIYVTLVDFKNNQYPHIKYREGCSVFPTIVTMEEWYLIGSDITTKMRELVKNKVILRGLSEDIVDEMPYLICSMIEYEDLLQALNEKTIQEIMAGWFIPEKYGHIFLSYIGKLIPTLKTLDKIFPEDFDKIIPDDIMEHIKYTRKTT